MFVVVVVDVVGDDVGLNLVAMVVVMMTMTTMMPLLLLRQQRRYHSFWLAMVDQLNSYCSCMCDHYRCHLSDGNLTDASVVPPRYQCLYSLT